MNNTEMNRMELLKDIKGYNRDIIIGVQGTRVITLHICTMFNKLELYTSAYNVFKVDTTEITAKHNIYDDLMENGLNGDLSEYLYDNGVYINDIVRLVYSKMDDEKKLDLRHINRLDGTKFTYNKAIYMLEECYLSEHETFFPMLTLERFENGMIYDIIEKLYENKHLQLLEELNVEELNVLNNLLDDNLKLEKYLNDETVKYTLVNNLKINQ